MNLNRVDWIPQNTLDKYLILILEKLIACLLGRLVF